MSIMSLSTCCGTVSKAFHILRFVNAFRVTKIFFLSKLYKRNALHSLFLLMSIRGMKMRNYDALLVHSLLVPDFVVPAQVVAAVVVPAIAIAALFVPSLVIPALVAPAIVEHA